MLGLGERITLFSSFSGMRVPAAHIMGLLCNHYRFMLCILCMISYADLILYLWKTINRKHKLVMSSTLYTLCFFHAHDKLQNQNMCHINNWQFFHAHNEVQNQNWHYRYDYAGAYEMILHDTQNE